MTVDLQPCISTNSSHLPVDYTADIFDALDIQDELQTLYTSGTVFHAFLGEKLPDWKAAADLIRTIAENYKLPYYTLSPTYSICKEHGYLAGEQNVCPHCGKVTEVYSRITGYYRPVQNWNDGKLQEYENRKTYDVKSSVQKRLDNEVVLAKEKEKAAENPTDYLQAVAERKEKEAKALKEQGDVAYLFTTKTCPNCNLAKEYLKDFDYELIDAEENIELVKKYRIMQAPTLVVIKDGEISKYGNASGIKAFSENL